MWRLEDLGKENGGIAEAARTLLDHGTKGQSEAAAFFVPGRIEVLGKHTDYAGGRSLLAATGRGFSLVSLPRADARLTILDATRRRRADLELHVDLKTATGDWTSYPAAVARRLARNFSGGLRGARLRGADVAFTNDLPAAAGMSSSSALIVATYLALARWNALEERSEYRAEIRSREELAGYLATVENGQSFGTLAGDRGVGTFGGSEDHTAILCSRPGELRQYSYCPVRFERAIPLPEGHVFAVAASGVEAKKTGAAKGAYNRASLLAAEAADVWRRSTGGGEPHLAAILATAEPGRLADVLAAAADLAERAEHFKAESEDILPAAGDALARGDLVEWGRQVDRSQALAEKLLGNQVPETIFLARVARELGATAASAFGAGFGGSVWALVDDERPEEFLRDWARRYLDRFGGRADRASFFLTPAGAGATELLQGEPI